MKSIVVKSNILVNSSYNLDLNEHRLLNLASARQYHLDNIIGECRCKVSVEDYSKEYGVSYKEALVQIKNASLSLKNKTVFIAEFYYGPLPWVDRIDFENNDELYVVFNEGIVSNMFGLKGKFTQYQLEAVKMLKNSNALRLYELMKSKDNKSKRSSFVFTVDEVYQLMKIEEYSRAADLKRMLDTCLIVINEHSDISVKMKPKKRGHAIVSFGFECEYLKKTEPAKVVQLVKQPSKKTSPDKARYFQPEGIFAVR